MFRPLIFILLAACVLIPFADLGIASHLDPWLEMKRFGKALLDPELKVLWEYKGDLFNTVVLAFISLIGGVCGGIVFALNYNLRIVRLFSAFLRSIHEIFWAFLFLSLVGQNEVCAILSIALPYSGIFAKVYAEILQEVDQRPLQGLPQGSDKISFFLFGTLPTIYKAARDYTRYRLECALRSSAVIGFIGLPTLGYHLESFFSDGYYREAAAFIYAFLVLIGLTRLITHRYLILPYIIGSCCWISWEIHCEWINVKRFFSDITPAPLRNSEGFGASLQWLKELFVEAAAPGLWNTLVLCGLSLALTALLALAFFPFASKALSPLPLRLLSKFALLIGRTIPEYILAFVLLLFLGPSMLPGCLTISLHNSCVIAHLISERSELIQLSADSARRRFDRYIYEVLPRIFAPFLAFLFYRWEVMMRESAILGILGIATLGFYIDSAKAAQQLDKAFMLILFGALANMLIDALSQKIRKCMRLTHS